MKKTSDADYAIRVSNLTKKFGSFVAVDNISFSVEKGKIFAFLGPNGAGKTTTIKMLTTLLNPTSGVMSVNGFDPVRNEGDTRKSFGIVFQDPSLDDELTAYENLEFHGVLYRVPKKILKKKIDELLKFIELWDRRNDLVKHFSGGMKRRLEIARGLIHEPQILFLDEPTLGLDPQTRNHIWGYIKNLNSRKKITVFFTTHYMEEAERVAGRIAVIDRGKIVSIGTSAELKSKTGSNSLEDAFLSLTGKTIRDEESTPLDHLRMVRRHFTRGK